MKVFLSLFLTVVAVTAETTANTEDENGRRYLMPKGTECVTYKRIMEIVDGSDLDSWVCELSDSDASRFGRIAMKIELDTVASTAEFDAMGAISGGSILRTSSESYVEKTIVGPTPFSSGSGASVFYLSPDADFEIEKMEVTDARHYSNRGRRRRRRRLNDEITRTTGEFKVLVTRVISSDKKQTGLSLTDLDEDIFTDASNLATLYNACSYGKLTMKKHNIIDLDIDINLGQSMLAKPVEDAAQEASYRLYTNKETLQETVDLVMHCFPPGTLQVNSQGQTFEWIAYAFLNGFESFYDDEWCKKASTQVHEVGHNLNLGHGGIPPGAPDRSEYGDQSGLMGFSYDQDDGPNMCFNAPQSYQLGWYDDKIQEINPLSLPGGTQTFDLIGIADYQSISGGIVSLLLRYQGNSGGLDWYVGYNRVTGINNGVPNDPDAGPNLVLITQKAAGPYEFANTLRVAAIGALETYSWNVGGTTVSVRVNSISGGKASITVTNGSAPPQTPDPTTAPTPTAPVPPPTTAPTANPTTAPVPPPTTAPTANPTTAPVPPPTTAPAPDPTTAPIPPPTTAPAPDPTTAPVPPPTTAPAPDPTTAPVPLTLPPTANPTTTPESTPTSTPTSELVPTASPTGCITVTLDFTLDQKSGSEFGWSLFNPVDNFGWEAEQNFNFPPAARGIYSICIPRNRCYTLYLTDFGSDGICCDHGQGSYEFSVSGQVVSTGGSWIGLTNDFAFCIGTADGTCADKPGNFYLKLNRNKVSKSNCNGVRNKAQKNCHRRLGCRSKRAKKCGNKGRAYDRCPTGCGTETGQGPCGFLQNYPLQDSTISSTGVVAGGSSTTMIKVDPVSIEIEI